MKHIICSDIHGNLEAIEAVLSFITSIDHGKIIHLGDVVGYGANPLECIELVDKSGIESLAGNHDIAVSKLSGIEYFNRHARKAVIWTRQQLDSSKLQWLDSLPLTYKSGAHVMVHSTPDHPMDWNYVLTIFEAEIVFSYMAGNNFQICFIGHSHQPIIFEQDIEGNIRFSSCSKIRLKKNYRYIINVGSVGQPRDGNPAACVAYFDSETLVYELFRVDYPIHVTQDKMRRVEINPFLINRLSDGK